MIDNTEIQAVDEPAADFLKTAQDYSKMYELFDKTGVIKTWQEKNLMYTIMVVGNESTANANQPVTKAEGSEGQATAEEIFKAEAHITDALLSPSNLEDGQRLLMWNGKYVTVRIYDEPVDGMEQMCIRDRKWQGRYRRLYPVRLPNCLEKLLNHWLV